MSIDEIRERWATAKRTRSGVVLPGYDGDPRDDVAWLLGALEPPPAQPSSEWVTGEEE